MALRLPCLFPILTTHLSLTPFLLSVWIGLGRFERLHPHRGQGQTLTFGLAIWHVAFGMALCVAATDWRQHLAFWPWVEGAGLVGRPSGGDGRGGEQIPCQWWWSIILLPTSSNPVSMPNYDDGSGMW